MKAWERFIDGWLEIADGLVQVLSLGFLRVSLSYNFVMWLSKRQALKAKAAWEAEHGQEEDCTIGCHKACDTCDKFEED